ncbi:hypothetical protein [Clostridium taeniosporum]|uniref:hypothetical protein n=1 Tax=Clostridium taeniosporum TaxID=394958 RepID=UPI001314C4D7|nr:hypothetical protein [Clostridium taeniosporum]
MNNDEVVKKMIDFIEEKERQLQVAKFVNNSRAKSDIVNSIIFQLDREVNDEN